MADQEQGQDRKQPRVLSLAEVMKEIDYRIALRMQNAATALDRFIDATLANFRRGVLTDVREALGATVTVIDDEGTTSP